MDSSSSSSPPFHLALATLFGASVMAISAFYIHKRSVDQVLLKLTRRKSSRIQNSTNNDNNLVVSNTDAYKFRDEIDEIDESSVEWFRVSSSVPNVGLPNEWLNQDSVNTVSNSISNMSNLMDDQLDLIPSGLPPLRTDHTDGNKFMYIFS